MNPGERVSEVVPNVEGFWTEGPLPANARVGRNTVMSGEFAFKRFHSEVLPALIVGDNCTMDDVHFALGKRARVTIGEYCYLSSALLLCELEISIGSHVVMGWNVTVADTDFHPLDPALRIVDAVACSPRGKGLPRPVIAQRPVHIGSDVWIGPGATILKGVTIGDGAFIEPGAVVLRDVPAGAHIIGNPATPVDAS